MGVKKAVKKVKTIMVESTRCLDVGASPLSTSESPEIKN